MIVVLALIALLAIEAPACHPLIVPIAVTHQAAPIDGVPVLIDGAAVTVRCNF